MAAAPPDRYPIVHWPAKYIGEVTTPDELANALYAAHVQDVIRAGLDARAAAEHGLTLDTRFKPTEDRPC